MMPIEYEMMILFRETKDAILHYGNIVEWSDAVSEQVRTMVDTENTDRFDRNSLSAMKDLRRRGYWIRWNEEHGGPLLYKT
jgi:hypothetical protein